MVPGGVMARCAPSTLPSKWSPFPGLVICTDVCKKPGSYSFILLKYLNTGGPTRPTEGTYCMTDRGEPPRRPSHFSLATETGKGGNEICKFCATQLHIASVSLPFIASFLDGSLDCSLTLTRRRFSYPPFYSHRHPAPHSGSGHGREDPLPDDADAVKMKI